MTFDWDTAVGDMGPPYREVLISKIYEGVQRRISRELVVRLSQHDFSSLVARDLVLELEAEVLAETLPPLTLTDRQTFATPRFATWVDHFVATYRQRWWGRLLRLREPRYVDEPLTHTVTTEVRSRWTYPQATTVLPGDRFGHVVLKVDTSQRGGMRWF